MRQVQVFRIVVGSPGDVLVERDAVEEIAAELNRGIAEDKALRIDVVRWETHTYPGFDPNGPQFLIDPSLDIEGADLFLGIFWKRFGTPVSDAPSGTIHEFKNAFEEWKKKGSPQVWFYFNKTPYSPQSAREATQWASVLQFKEDYPPEGLWWPYEGTQNFKDLLRNHLTNYLRRQFPNPL